MRAMHFADQLTQKSHSTSPISVGLDPLIEKLPDGLTKDLDGMKNFCLGILDAVQSIACCIKPQLACFELLGWEGMKLFWELCHEAKERDFLVIADGKRNDIGSTCEAYAGAYLYEGSPISALTVNPYLGSESMKPFIKRCIQNDKGIFVLVKTSNVSAGELQDLPVGDEVLYEHLAQLVAAWGGEECLSPESGLSCIGAVVGATYPEELKYLRSLMPHTPFLIPGYGIQGATAEDVRYGFHSNGTGAIVNASRSILYASSETDWKDAAKKKVEEMKMDLNV